MDNDDDYQSFSPPKEISPSDHGRRLKRLKKLTTKPSIDSLPLTDSIDDPLLFQSVDFTKLEALENGSEALDFNDSQSSDLLLSQESLSQGAGNESEVTLKQDFDVEVKKTRRILEFDDDGEGGLSRNEMEYAKDFDTEKADNEAIDEEDLFEKLEDDTEKNKKRENIDIGGEDNECFVKENDVRAEIEKVGFEITEDEKKKKKNKKRPKSNSGGELKAKLPAPNKRREEKERKIYLKELHCESQRLLRETGNAAFKPIPLVQKPISSVLEKIRKRKLEVSLEISKKAMIVDDMSCSDDENDKLRDSVIDVDVSKKEKGGEENALKTLDNEIVAPYLDLDASDLDVLKQTSLQKNICQVSLNEEPRLTPSFEFEVSRPTFEEPTSTLRAPVDDTQDLFGDSEPDDDKDEQYRDHKNNPLDEDFAPSLLTMNLKFDSAPVDDSSSDEDDDENYSDKENIDPRPHGVDDGDSSPVGDPVKDFVDDEAVEDDSDNDLIHFTNNEEDEDIEDVEELNEIIATDYEERPIDNERRNQLHQEWLQQQDAAGTDNLLQKLRCGPVLRDTDLPSEEVESDEDDEQFGDEDKEDSTPRILARSNTKKTKQIILPLISDKEDVYVSDEDEDSYRRLAQRYRIRKEEHAQLVSPAHDESSREIFGLIKKLNIASDSKKKPKSTSFFDSVLKGGNSYSSTKSSFLGRVSNHSITLSLKQGSGVYRSFVFGRDDSSSRSSMSLSEDSSDTVAQETLPTRTATAKFSGSQTKFSSQNRDVAMETASRTSLLEILKRSSSQAQVCNQDCTVDLTKNIFAFRAPKKSLRIE